MKLGQYMEAPTRFQVLRACLFCRGWARRRGVKFRKVPGRVGGLIELPTGQRFSFSLWQQRKLSDLPGLARQMEYQLGHASEDDS